jgi:hypothetical protein
MARHTVEFKDLEGGVVERELCRSVGKGSDKALNVKCVLDSPVVAVYMVYNQDKLVYQGDSLQAAVDLYNLLP